jgi:hypothetical protein
MLVDSLARVKITDFGLARVKVENTELTSRGLTVGTPTYMSPEQVRGEELDARSDLFALGCVIYAMLTGHSPFHGRSALDIARRIDGYEPPYLTKTHSSVPDFLASIVQRLLKKDRDDRYQSAAEVADVLNRHLAILNQTPTDRLPAALQMGLLKSRSDRKPAKVIAWVAALAASLTAVWFGWNYFGRANETSSQPATLAALGDAVVPSVPPAARKPEVTVAKTGAADFASISEALQHVAAGGRVTILDDGEYVEPLRLVDAQQHAGVQIIAPRQAMLRSDQSGPVILIRGIPNLRLEGLKIVGPQSQFGIEITGNCPGLVLESIGIERTPNPAESSHNIAGLYLHAGASGRADQPIMIRRLALRSTIVGLVIGDRNNSAAATSHILIEESLIDGPDRSSATLLTLLGSTQDLIIRRNIFARGLQGLSIVAERAASPSRCEFEHNSWHDIQTWIVWTGPAGRPPDLHHNLLVNVDHPAVGLQSLAADAGGALLNNVVYNPQRESVDDFAPFANTVNDFAILSDDVHHADYLKPDFTRISTAALSNTPIAGRYSEKQGR